MNIPEDNNYSIKSIRFVELSFDIIKNAETHFVLYRGDKVTGTVLKSSLNDKTISKLTSLSEPER